MFSAEDYTALPADNPWVCEYILKRSGSYCAKPAHFQLRRAQLQANRAHEPSFLCKLHLPRELVWQDANI